MITISCYTFHPLIQRFVRLYKRVQVVADWLTCILSVFCCTCLPPLPLSTSTSHTSYSMDKKPTIDTERAGSGEPLQPQCVSIDFTPQPQDTDETAARCNQFWDLVKSQAELDGIMVTSEKTPYTKIDECVPVHKKSESSRSNVETKKTLPDLKSGHSHHKGAAKREEKL